MARSGEQVRGRRARGSLERGGPHPRGRPAPERGGTSPEGGTGPRARRASLEGGVHPSSEADFARGGVQPSSEAEPHPRGGTGLRARGSFVSAAPLERSGVPPKGAWANCFGGPLGPLGSRLCCVCFGLANLFVFVFLTRESGFSSVL
jgi:hypothetical protein